MCEKVVGTIATQWINVHNSGVPLLELYVLDDIHWNWSYGFGNVKGNYVPIIKCGKKSFSQQDFP